MKRGEEGSQFVIDGDLRDPPAREDQGHPAPFSSAHLHTCDRHFTFISINLRPLMLCRAVRHMITIIGQHMMGLYYPLGEGHNRAVIRATLALLVTPIAHEQKQTSTSTLSVQDIVQSRQHIVITVVDAEGLPCCTVPSQNSPCLNNDATTTEAQD